MKNTNYIDSRLNSEYRFGFNGKEKDDEITGVTGSHIDYGMRMYDSRIGRFMSVDPISKDFPFYTPYQFAGNKPIMAVDLDGMEEFVVIDYKDVTGNLYKTEIKLVNPSYTKYDLQIVHRSTVQIVDDQGNFCETYNESRSGSIKEGTNPFNNELEREFATGRDAQGNIIITDLNSPKEVTLDNGSKVNAYGESHTPNTIEPKKDVYDIGYYDASGNSLGIDKNNKVSGNFTIDATQKPDIYKGSYPTNDIVPTNIDPTPSRENRTNNLGSDYKKDE